MKYSSLLPSESHVHVHAHSWLQLQRTKRSFSSLRISVFPLLLLVLFLLGWTCYPLVNRSRRSPLALGQGLPLESTLNERLRAWSTVPVLEGADWVSLNLQVRFSSPPPFSPFVFFSSLIEIERNADVHARRNHSESEHGAAAAVASRLGFA